MKKMLVKLGKPVLLAMAKARLIGSIEHPRSRHITIVADLGKANGIASGARSQARAAISAGFDVELVDSTELPVLGGLSSASEKPGTTLVLHCGAPETAILLNRVISTARRARTVGYWAWELPIAPPEWKKYETLVDEIWTPSEFSAGALRDLFVKPVHVVPHKVGMRSQRRRSPDGPFKVLMMFDTRSSLTRKNPWGGLAAYCEAFPREDEAQLIVKVNGRVEDGSDVRAAFSSRSDVEFVEQVLTPAGVEALFDRADAFLSLHRSEGFGLPMLQAMARGIPTIATGWSGNTEFMSEPDSMLVPYTLIPVRDESKVYRVRSHWAEPDVTWAASALRRLFSDHQLYEDYSDAAYRKAAEHEARQSWHHFPSLG